MQQTHGDRSGNTLDKENSLGFDHDKVDELMGITDERVDGGAGDSVVSAGAQLCSDALVEKKLANRLGRNSDSQSHPGQPKAVTGDINVSEGEDGKDGRDERNGRSAWETTVSDYIE